jgi:hypothetical protein
MVRFVNELGNLITIDAEPYNDPKGFIGVRISITGPSSEVTNEITVEEAKHMNDVLHVCLDATQRGHSPPADPTSPSMSTIYTQKKWIPLAMASWPQQVRDIVAAIHNRSTIVPHYTLPYNIQIWFHVTRSETRELQLALDNHNQVIYWSEFLIKNKSSPLVQTKSFRLLSEFKTHLERWVRSIDSTYRYETEPRETEPHDKHPMYTRLVYK